MNICKQIKIPYLLTILFSIPHNKIPSTHEDLQLLNKIALVEYIQEENIKETNNQSYKQKVEKIEIKPELDNTEITGKSFSEALIFAEHGENMLCT